MTDEHTLHTCKQEQDEIQHIKEYMENCYSGAKMMDAEELKLRLARAITAFDLDIYKDCIIQSK